MMMRGLSALFSARISISTLTFEFDSRSRSDPVFSCSTCRHFSKKTDTVAPIQILPLIFIVLGSILLVRVSSIIENTPFAVNIRNLMSYSQAVRRTVLPEWRQYSFGQNFKQQINQINILLWFDFGIKAVSWFLISWVEYYTAQCFLSVK